MNIYEKIKNELKNDLLQKFPMIFEYPCTIEWGTHTFDNYGDFLTEIIIAINMCDGNEKTRYQKQYEKLKLLFKSGKLKNAKITLRG